MAKQQQVRSSYWRDSFYKLRRHKLAVCGFVILISILLLVTVVPVLFKLDPVQSDVNAFGQKPSSQYILGTDELGRDSFARVLYGGRISLLVGFVSTLISAIIGVPLGVLAGFYRGWLEQVIMRLSEVFMSIPSMILALVMVAISGPSITTLIVVIGIMGWPEFAKLMYASSLATREKDYIESARAVGSSSAKIIRKYLIPNSFSPIIVAFTFRTASAIIQESALSFLGMGVQPPAASWGNILYDAQSISILSGKPWLWIPAGLMLVLTISSINFLGDGLRDSLDTKMSLQ